MFATVCIKYRGFPIYRKCNDNDGIYAYLEKIVGAEEAIEIASWCEFATVGDEYESGNPDLEIYIVD